MKGPLQFVWLAFTVFRFQRWIGALGLLMLLGAWFVPRAAAPGMVIWGSIALLFVPTVLGGTFLRSVLARRPLSLVPFGRQQILLGSLVRTLLQAGLITFCAWALRFDELPDLMRISFGELFWRIEAAATVLLLGGFLASRTVAGISLWGLLVALTLGSFLKHGPWAGVGVPQLGTLTVLGWAVLAIVTLRASVIAQPAAQVWERGVAETSSSRWFTPALNNGVSALLTEQPSDAQRLLVSCIVVAILCGMAAFVAFLGNPQATWQELLSQSYPLALTYLVGATPENMQLAARARRLWLRGALDRQELFRLCEKLAWRGVVLTFVPVAVLMVICLLAASQGMDLNLQWFIVNAIFAPLGVYFGLMMTRGWRWPEILFGLALLAAWAALLISAPDWPVSLLLIVAAAALLAAGLRAFAMRRWLAIDWVVCRLSRAGRELQPAHR